VDEAGAQAVDLEAHPAAVGGGVRGADLELCPLDLVAAVGLVQQVGVAHGGVAPGVGGGLRVEGVRERELEAAREGGDGVQGEGRRAGPADPEAVAHHEQDDRELQPDGGVESAAAGDHSGASSPEGGGGAPSGGGAEPAASSAFSRSSRRTRSMRRATARSTTPPTRKKSPRSKRSQNHWK